METRQEITALGKTDDSKPLVVGNHVYDRLLTVAGVADFPVKKYLFLQLRRNDVPIEEAALKLNIDLEDAKRFDACPKAQQYLDDRRLAAVIAAEAKDKDRFWVRANAILEGQIPASKAQIEALKLVAVRVDPTVGEHHASQPKIEIHIDAAAFKEALRREAAIEAEIVKESNAA